MQGEDDNALDNFRPYEDEKSTSKMQNIERDHKDLIGKNSDTGSHAGVGYTPQDWLLGSESSLSLIKVRFSEQEFSTGTPVFNIKYDHLESQNDSFFYPFHNQLNYALAYYIIESETTKDNKDKFLSNILMALLTEKLSYQNADEWIEKLSEILQGIFNTTWIKHKFEL